MSTDKVIQNGKWEFNSEVASCFDDMFSRSIPCYDSMREIQKRILTKYTGNGYVTLLDIGCANGCGVPFIPNPQGRVDYHGIDLSEDMVNVAKSRYEKNPFMLFEVKDVMDVLTPSNRKVYDVIQSIFTIQFIPVEKRQRLFEQVYEHLARGGVFLFFEKVLGDDAYLEDSITDIYYDMKRDHGYTEEQIQGKRKSLENSLVPLKNEWNIQLLRESGFKHVQEVWRAMNFVGYLCVK